MTKVAKTPLKPKKPRKSGTRGSKRFNAPLTTMQDMNDDCLMGVFDHLDINSLMKMCKLSTRFESVITQRVIPLKTINFADTRETRSTRKIFQKFGPSMTRIIFDEKDLQMVTFGGGSSFASFVRLVMQYCTPGKLQQMSLSGFSGFADNEIELATAARPYFENVHTICIDFEGTWHTLRLFEYILPKENLRHLTLHNVLIVSKWLTVENLPNLQTFHLCKSCNHTHPYNRAFYEAANLSQLKAYIANKPMSLTSFDYIGTNHDEIMQDVSMAMPNVTKLGTLRMESAPPLNDANNNHQAKSVRQKWQHLNGFVGLKEFSIQSFVKNFANCGEIFRILATRNTIEKLELLTGRTAQANATDPINEHYLRQMTNVQTLQLNDFGHADSDEFLTQLYQNLTGLTKCTVLGGCLKQASITSLVQNALKLRVLEIECKMTAFSSVFYKRLVRIRKANESVEPLVIKINGTVVNAVQSKLGKRSYKPAIITLKHI